MEAFKYVVDVNNSGQITIPEIPELKSSRVEIIILPVQAEDHSDLLNASESSTEFWNNSTDEIWNDV